MATFVLVAGATLGAWCWKRVTPLLRSSGHDVYPVTLTGLAERAHLASDGVDPETHIQDIVRLLEAEDLTDVILVGHSLSGGAVTGAADRVSERIAQLVYFDAVVPVNGKSLLELSDPEWQTWVRGRVIETEFGPLFQPPDSRNFGLSDEKDIHWVNSKMTPHPFKTWSDPIHLYNENKLAQLSKTFITCIGDKPPGQPRVPESQGMHYYELPYGHMAMINAPHEVSSLLQTIAAQPVTDRQ
jgi:pimeloyl-ACP methyl ester carboxylesterase